jgi:hypothetical protein
MNDETAELLEKLSSRSVLVRKQAIRELRWHARNSDGHIARLCLHYMSEHDPSYTVRNIAKQAFYQISLIPPSAGGWERVHAFSIHED